MPTTTRAFTTPEPRPAAWDTNTAWPIRLRLGNHAVHAAANFFIRSSGTRCWTACGRPTSGYRTSMPAGWPVNCRGCRQTLATQAEAAAR